MKAFLKSLMLFTPFFLVCYSVLVILFGLLAPKPLQKNLIASPIKYGYMFTRSMEADTTKDVDILFLGSSHAYRTYDTRIFRDSGYRVFNLGSSAQSPKQTQVLVEKYLEKFNPKLVIIDIAPRMFEIDGIESSIDIVLNNKLPFTSAVKMSIKSADIKVFNTMLYSQFRYAMGLNNNLKEPFKKKEGKYIPGGFVESYQSNPRTHNTYDSYTYKIDPDQLNTFHKIVETLQDKKIDYLLVQSPISKNLFQSCTNNNEIDSIFSKSGTYINYNKRFFLQELMFYDGDHMNQYGVNYFNPILIQDVRKLSHR